MTRAITRIGASIGHRAGDQESQGCRVRLAMIFFYFYFTVRCG